MNSTIIPLLVLNIISNLIAILPEVAALFLAIIADHSKYALNILEGIMIHPDDFGQKWYSFFRQNWFKSLVDFEDLIPNLSVLPVLSVLLAFV